MECTFSSALPEYGFESHLWEHGLDRVFWCAGDDFARHLLSVIIFPWMSTNISLPCGNVRIYNCNVSARSPGGERALSIALSFHHGVCPDALARLSHTLTQILTQCLDDEVEEPDDSGYSSE